jgi:hypothetical protein
VQLSTGLFLLGLGWSFTLVSGSTLLSESVAGDVRTGVQGAADLVMGLCGAGGGALAGVVVGLSGFGVLNLAAAVLLFGLAAISVWQGWHVLDESLLFDSRASTPLQTPMWIPQGLWFIGLAVFAGVTGACAVHAVILFVRDRGRLNELYGPLSLEGQIAVETQGTLPGVDKPV